MTKPSISLCVITGNEEATIIRFLDSFSAAFDELCLVRAIGTVKHDRTVQMARDWCHKNGKAVRVGEYFNRGNPDRLPLAEGVVDDMDPGTWPHVDDFSAARNMAWDLATGQWQFWADVDDVLLRAPAGEHGGVELLRLCALADSHDYFLFKYSLSTQGESVLRERLFRTGIARWIQPVHEQCRVFRQNPKGGDWKALIEPRIVHEHLPLVEKNRDAMRNRRIMLYQTRYVHTYAFEIHREFFYQWQCSKSKEDAEASTKWGELALQTDCLPEQKYDLLVHQAEVVAGKDPDHALDLLWSAFRIRPLHREALGRITQTLLAVNRGAAAAEVSKLMQIVPKPQATGYPRSEKFYGWEGADLRLRALRAAGKGRESDVMGRQIFDANGARFSLLHATRGRPEKALETRGFWFRAAFVPLGVEHIFAIDEDDTASLEALKDYRHVVVPAGGGCVAAWNAAAAASAGAVLLQLSDDWTPCREWDAMMWEALDAAAKKADPAGDMHTVPLVLAIHDNHRTDALLCMAILTRARYEAQGREMFSAEYKGVFSDNELTFRAYRDGVVVQAQYIICDHAHPIFKGIPVAEWDETYQRQNAPERYAEGLAIYRRRNPDSP